MTVGAAVAVWAGAARQPVARRRPWQLIAWGVSLSAVADLCYWAYEVFRAPAPDASIITPSPDGGAGTPAPEPQR